jgi:3-hydroxy-9,10-secoandrosta-1,3,5(10)-triene-9,17-dione monooxygenase
MDFRLSNGAAAKDNPPMASTLTSISRTPTEQDMIERARALVPALKERAAACEAGRRLPEATHRDLLDAGLYRALSPRRFGGYELDYGILIDVAAELGRGCASTAWVWSQLVAHNLCNSMLPQQGQEDYWADGPDVQAASASPNPGATTRRVDGGYVLDGAWGFASGVDVCSWNIFLCFVAREGGGAPVTVFCLAPQRDYEIVDDWFPVGLSGTGSKQIRVRELFVPDHRTMNIENCRGGPTAGTAINPGPLSQVSVLAAGSKLFSGPALGAARGALDAVRDEFAARVSVGGVSLANQQSVQIRLAHAEAKIDSAWALLKRDCAETMEWARRGAEPPLDVRVRWRRDDAFALRTCIEAVELLFPLTGGRGLSASSPFQRAWRDCHACGQQIMVNWDVMMTHFGRHMLGLPILDPRV